MRVLGIDPGSKRIGLALSDEEGLIAMPLRTVRRAGKVAAASEVAEAALAAEVSEVVVGLPLRLDGSEGPEARRARQFGAAIADATSLPVTYWDERLTTKQAEQDLRRAGAPARAIRAAVDAAAATIVLQSYLDSRRRAAYTPPA